MERKREAYLRGEEGGRQWRRGEDDDGLGIRPGVG